MNYFNPKLELKDTELAIKNKLVDVLPELRGFTFLRTLVIEFTKIESDNATKYTFFYSNSKAETIINDSSIDDVFESVYIMIASNIQKSLGKGSVSVIDFVKDQINISKYNPLAGSSYIKLPKELDHTKKV